MLTTLLNKTKSFIKSLKLRVSDLFLLIALLPGILFAIESSNLYINNDNQSNSVPFWLLTLLFTLFLVSISLYLKCELKKPLSNKKVLILGFVILYLILSQVITILTKPNIIITQMMLDDPYSIYDIQTTLNIHIKLTYLYTAVYCLIIFSIGLFIFPKRIQNKKILIFSIYVFYFVGLFALIYSLIKDDYVTYFSYLFSGKERSTEFDIQDYSPVSVFGNKNTYGTFLETGVFISLLNYHYTNKKNNIIIALYFYLHLILTLCKAGICITTLVLIIYLLSSLTIAIKNKDKKKTLHLGIVVSIILLIGIIGTLIILLNDKVNNLFTSLFDDITSLSGRTLLWYYAWQPITQNSIIFGSGFGIYNSVLSTLTVARFGYSMPYGHSWFITLIGTGGIILLIPYIALLIYSIVILTKIFKNNKMVGLVLFCLELTLFLHSCVEDYYYQVAVSIVIILVQNNIIEVSSKKQQID